MKQVIPGSISQVLVPVSKLSVANVRKAVSLLVIPSVPQLRLPHEGQCALDLVRDQLADDVSRVNVDGTDGHDLLTVAARQSAEQERDQVVELCDLFFVVVFDGGFVALFQLSEGDTNLQTETYF